MKDANSRQLRQINFISKLTTDVHYIEGKNNVVADCLSRSNDLNALFEGMDPYDFEAMSEAQKVDSEILNLACSDDCSLDLKYVTIPGTEKQLLGGTSLGQFRPVVLQALRKKVFETLHFLSRPGIKASQKLISQRFVWPGMRLDVIGFVNNCIACQLTKIHRHNRAPLQDFKLPDKRFQAVHFGSGLTLTTFRGSLIFNDNDSSFFSTRRMHTIERHNSSKLRRLLTFALGSTLWGP